MGRTPNFSPSMGSAKRLKASRISPSSWGVTLCSFASLDWRALGALPLPLAVTLRFGGCGMLRQKEMAGFGAIRDVPCVMRGFSDAGKSELL